MGKQKKKGKKWMCPVCDKPCGNKGVFTCIGCVPPQWIHPQCGGYGSLEELGELLKRGEVDVQSLHCNMCKDETGGSTSATPSVTDKTGGSTSATPSVDFTLASLHPQKTHLTKDQKKGGALQERKGLQIKDFVKEKKK